MSRRYWFAPGTIVPFLLALALPIPASAQISAAPDGTNTTINQTGNTFNINGGTQAGTNLFHSFQQFGLNPEQIANFLANPTIANILSRVTGGNASIIQGQIQVTGSKANLYLINPAGIVFGANASLNVPGAFTATTANGIGVGNGWFNAVGANNYTALSGHPNQFAFVTLQPGAIINAGNLVVGQGQSLTLLGGTVINTGTLTAPGGTVTIAAVPGEQLVRVSQTGSLLSLDLPTETRAVLNPASVPPLSLPALLTGGNLSNATGLTVENGAVKLTGSGVTLPTEAGVAIISNQINVSGTTGGTVHVLGDKVGVVGATIDASGSNGGGTVLIGGDYQGQGTVPNAHQTYVGRDSVINVDALQSGNGGRAIVWADHSTRFYGTINARGGAQTGNGGFVEVSGHQHLDFRGQVDRSAPNGIPGTLLLDPRDIVIQAAGANNDQLLADRPNPGDPSGQILAGDVSESVFTLAADFLADQPGTLQLEATNNITIAPGVSLNFTPSTGTITFRADADGDGAGSFTMDPAASLTTTGRSLVVSGASVFLGNVSTIEGGSSFGNNGDIRFPIRSGALTVLATNDIQVQRIFAGNVTLASQAGNITTGSISSEDRNLGRGSQVVLSAIQGTILLDGVIRAGQTNKITDSTIAIEAKQFRAINPVLEIESDLQGNRVQVNGTAQVQPMSLYAYPKDVDAAGDDSGGIRKVRLGQVAIGIGDDPFILTGSGDRLVTIRVLEDTMFLVGQPGMSGSGTAGVIAIGAERAPSAIVLLRDNVFNANLDPTPPSVPGTVATVLDNQQETVAIIPDCLPVAQTELLDISAVASLRGTEQEQATATTAKTVSNLQPCGLEP